jgi:molybdate transport system substrate-binding protein
MPPADGDAKIFSALVFSTALVTGCKADSAPPQPTVQVAAAADLSLAFAELGKVFEQRTGQKITFSFAASGTLAKQLSEGAPFDLFAAANSAFVDSAVKAGACDAASKAIYARGHIALWTKRGRATPAPTSLSELTQPEFLHIAIANPEHAPYGKAAREALSKAGLWTALEPKIVYAENVRQALQFAQTGNADAAIVARSLVAGDESGVTLAIDPALHAPIEQTLVVCRHGKNSEGGRSFAHLVQSTDGQALLKRYGFAGSTEQNIK